MNTRNERGSVLMLVVVFSLIMCLLGFAVLYMNGNAYLAARRDLLDARAAYLADAGLAMGVSFLYHCDARLEDKDDMKIAENEFNDSKFAKTTRGAVVLAMGSNPSHGNKYGKNLGDGTYCLTESAPLQIDNAYPPAWCDVWISSRASISSVDNLKSTDGHYYYTISARGVASYGITGTVDSVKEEDLMIEISSTSTTAKEGVGADTLYDRGNRYNFNYRLITGRRFVERPIKRVIH